MLEHPLLKMGQRFVPVTVEAFSQNLPARVRYRRVFKAMNFHGAQVRPTATSLKHRWFRIPAGLRWSIVILAAALIGFRLALPTLLKNYVNKQLSKSPEYRGSVGDIGVHLYRGAYRIHQIAILKTTSDIPSPLFAARVMDLSIQWKELFHGSLVGEVSIEEPEVNFVDGPTEAQSQTGKGNDWNKTLEDLFPFTLNRLAVHGGQVHFQNLHSTPPVDIAIKQLFATATNLTNSRDLKRPLPAGVNAKGDFGAGSVEVQVQLDPFAVNPTFEMTAQITNVTLIALNDFLRAYGKFDVERGTFNLYSSVASKEGTYEGYVKVFFENLDVFDWEKERKKNALQIFWQAIVGTLTTVFKNQPNDSLATRIPIAGSFEKTDVGVWPAIGTLLRHAFIRALIPKLDEKVKVNLIEQEGKEPDAKKAEEKKAKPELKIEPHHPRSAGPDPRPPKP